MNKIMVIYINEGCFLQPHAPETKIIPGLQIAIEGFPVCNPIPKLFCETESGTVCTLIVSAINDGRIIISSRYPGTGIKSGIKSMGERA